MNILANLASTQDSTIAGERDSLGGARVLNSGIHLLTVEMAYIIESKGGAYGLELRFKAENNDNLRQTIYFTSGREKGQKNFFEKDGKKSFLPGFLLVNSLCLLTVAKELSQVVPEEKLVNVWDSTQKKELPKKVPVLMELIGKKVYAAVFKQIEDKTKLEGNEYVPTGETIEKNEIDKFFRESDRMTVAEVMAHAQDPQVQPIFFGQWSEKWTDKVRDKTTGKKPPLGSGAGAGTLFGGAGAAAPNGAAGRPTSSLFSK